MNPARKRRAAMGSRTSEESLWRKVHLEFFTSTDGGVMSLLTSALLSRDTSANFAAGSGRDVFEVQLALC